MLISSHEVAATKTSSHFFRLRCCRHKFTPQVMAGADKLRKAAHGFLPVVCSCESIPLGLTRGSMKGPPRVEHLVHPLMKCFWLRGFFNSDAGRRVIMMMMDVAWETKIRNCRSQGLQVE